jgi:penicillin-binding protein 1A
LNDLRKALAAKDIVIVQPPGFTPDLIRNGFVPDSQDFALGQRPAVEGAIVAMDPHTGRLLAMTGGYNYAESEFNRATQAMRQPGSAFKPFVYLAALDAGFSPTTRILDAPLVVDQGQGKPKWKPANYTKRFYGPSIMRLGIEKSRNLMTARLAMNLGMDTVQEYAQRFGLNDNLPPLLSMSLGAGETTLLRLTAAYGMLVNGGHKITPSLIDRIQDRHGKTIYRHDKRQCPKCDRVNDMRKVPLLSDDRPQITSPASAFQMVSMLEGVVKRGTGRFISDLGLAVAGKTGTTNDSISTWFSGYHSDLVTTVWVGTDDFSSLGKNEFGSTIALPIWLSYMDYKLKFLEVSKDEIPQNISFVRVNKSTGEVDIDSKENFYFELFLDENIN